MSRSGWIALLSVASGCMAVGPDYVAPRIKTPGAYGDAAVEQVSSQDLARWWEYLGDSQLTELVERVLSSNLEIGAAIQRIEFARASYGVATSGRWPAVAAGGSYRRAKERGIPGVGALATTNQWTAGSDLSWEIDLFGRVRRSIEAAAASLEAEVEDLHSVQVVLVAETVATYMQALSLRERIGIAARNVGGQEVSLDIANRRFDAGMTAALDPAQARVNLRSTAANVPELELQLRRALHRLAVLTGIGPRLLLDEVAVDVALPELPDKLMVGIPADLLRNRPDIRGLERRLAAQTAQVGVATASLYPAINLAGAWDWLARSPDKLFDSGAGFGSGGPLVSVPLFNGGRLRGQVSAEEAALREIDFRLRQRVLVAQEEVENALFAVVRDRQQMELLREAQQAAQQAAELARHLYTSGQSDFQNVLDSERSLYAIEDALALSKLRNLLDVVDLYRAVGGGWGHTRGGH